MKLRNWKGKLVGPCSCRFVGFVWSNGIIVIIWLTRLKKRWKGDIKESNLSMIRKTKVQ